MEQKAYRIPLGVTNCWLLPCTEGYLLIDTCYSDTYPRFLRILKQMNISPGEIRYLLLTHHHEDHSGFAARLAEDAGCRIIAHEKALRLLKTGSSENTMTPLNLRTKAAFALFRIFRKSTGFPPVDLSINDIIIFGDNDTLLPELGIDGEILETPGHTADSISVLLSDGSLFAGDAVMNILRLCGTRYQPIYAENYEEVNQSREKLKEKGARMIYPAHGSPFPIERLD
jgi:glyoxylase-like metal-dependent hydrolase (beta-lactamase superfamily II)